MGLGHKRTDLQANAQAKLDDAMLLFKNERFSNSYYLAGYAVEIGVKACIAKQIARDTVPTRDFLRKFFEHNFKTLIGLAGLAEQLKKQQTEDPNFAANWALVLEWDKSIRYESVDRSTAHLMIIAVAEPSSGVFPWIQTHW